VFDRSKRNSVWNVDLAGVMILVQKHCTVIFDFAIMAIAKRAASASQHGRVIYASAIQHRSCYYI
jgi:hypothetical protein